MLSTVGTRHEDIASVLNISHDTLVKYYKEELDKGRIEANASVAETLFKQAKEGNTTAMIFWLKSRAKWKESTQHEISGNPDGSPVEVKIITGIE
jgi:phosphohistidine phosphatase SixA